MPAKKTPKEKAVRTEGKASQNRIAETGLNTRVKGHLSASTRKAQAKRDSKND